MAVNTELAADMKEIRDYFLEDDKIFFVINRQNPKRNAKGDLTDELIDGITIHIGKIPTRATAESLVEYSGGIYGGEDSLSDISYANTRLEGGGFIMNIVPAITAALKLQREADRKKTEPKKQWKWPGYACLPRTMFTPLIAKYIKQINEVGVELCKQSGEEWANVECNWDEKEGDAGTGVMISIDDEFAPHNTCTKSGTLLTISPTLSLSFRVSSRDLEISDNITFLSGKKLVLQIKVKCGPKNVSTVFWDAGTYSNTAGANAKAIQGHDTVVANLIRLGMTEDVAEGLATSLCVSDSDIKGDAEVQKRHAAAMGALEKRARTSTMKISVSAKNFADQLVSASRDYEAAKDAADASVAGGADSKTGADQKKPRL